jgi:anti-sigma regulatory factor (Ser/Thr protein kinase)
MDAYADDARRVHSVLAGTFATDADAPRGARSLVEEIPWSLDDGTRADLHVALSELVANAVVHAPDGEIEVRILLEDDTVRIEVADEGTEPFDWPPEATPDHATGWGLHMVKAFTDRCGIEHRPWTVVWCEVDLGFDPTS